MTLKWAVCMEGIIDFIGHELAEMPSNSVGKAWYASAAPAVQVEIAGLCLGVCVTGGGGPCIGQFVTDGQGRSFNFHRVGMRRFLFMWVWSWRLKSCYVPILLTSKCKVMGRDYVVEELTEDSFDGIDIALFSAGGSISKKFGPIAAEKGTIVVDNSSAFRMEHGIPLVIPEVNPHAMAHIKFGTKKGALIANPNCSTIICLMAATPLHRYAKVKRMVVSTYQAASGAGAAAMAELEQQTREVLEGKQPTCKIFNQQYAFNLFSHNSNVYPNGYNEEEMKLVRETRKIWGDDDVKVTATCIRVPVMRAHAESINLEFEKAIDEETARQILKEADGVIVIDDRDANNFPTPLEVSSKDAVAVGRIRRDVSQNGGYGLDIFVCGDQIRKGAALNAVQIAEKLL